MSLIRLLIITITALSFHSAAHAGQYHICTDKSGKKLFTSEPCPIDHKSITKSYKRTNPNTNTTRMDLDTNESYQSMRDSNRRRELTRNIKKSEQNITTLERKRDNELAKLRKKKSHANNNTAGAIYLQSISTEMGTVNDRYKSKIESEQRSLDRMISELKEL